MSFKVRLAPLALGLLLGGCNTVYEHSLSTDPGMGEAVKYDMAVQTIDPDPVYSPDGAQPGDNGNKGSEAVKRYRTGAVKDVQTVSTAQSASGGGPR